MHRDLFETRLDLVITQKQLKAAHTTIDELTHFKADLINTDVVRQVKVTGEWRSSVGMFVFEANHFGYLSLDTTYIIAKA